MKRRPSVPGLLAVACLIAVLGLAGCATASRWVGMTQPDPALAKIAGQLAALEADPQVARFAPDALHDAIAAVEAAQHARGGEAHAKHLAFVAAKRVEIARMLTDIQIERGNYERLLAQRNAMGGGDKYITTLAQDAIGTQGVPKQLPPVAEGQVRQASADAATPPDEVAARRAEEPGRATATAAVPPAPSPPIPPPPAASSPAPGVVTAGEPAPPVRAAPRAAPHGTVAPAAGVLMSFTATDFDGRGRVTAAARDRMYDLLPKFVQRPKAKIIVSGGNAAQVAGVHAQLLGFGVPAWRLVVRTGSGPVTVSMTGAPEVP